MGQALTALRGIYSNYEHHMTDSRRITGASDRRRWRRFVAVPRASMTGVSHSHLLLAVAGAAVQILHDEVGAQHVGRVDGAPPLHRRL